MRTIQDEVRRSLTKYALLPVLFLALVGFALVGASWQHYVVGLSEERRAVAAEVIETEIADYEARAAYVAELGLHPADLRASRKARADLYAYLYHEVNITHDGTAFFLLDGNQTVLSNTDGLPPYLLPIGSSWGYCGGCHGIRTILVLNLSCGPTACRTSPSGRPSYRRRGQSRDTSSS